MNHLGLGVAHIETKTPDMAQDLSEKVRHAPQGPGCYLFKDALGYTIYVGKGKNIRNRVRQYFQSSSNENMRDKRWNLVRAIVDVDFLETATELDALLTEYRLIKQYRPWFNAQLKADKIHPYLRIHHQAGQYATLSVCSEKQKDGARYYSGFFDDEDARAALDTFGHVWKTPTCGKPVFLPGKQACLQYHLGTCLAPCEGKVALEDYQQVIREVTGFLDGQGQRICRRLKKQMSLHAAALEFEAAAVCKSQLTELEQLRRKCAKTYHFPSNKNIILLIRPYRSIGCTVFYIRNGCAIARKDFQDQLDPVGLQDLAKQIEVCIPLCADHWLEKGLVEIYADKLFLSIPSGKKEEQIMAAICTGYGQMIQRDNTLV